MHVCVPFKGLTPQEMGFRIHFYKDGIGGQGWQHGVSFQDWD